MVVSKFTSALAAAAVAAAGLLGATAANAAIYTGQYDPAYGGIFPDLGWKASAVFDVPAPCLALGNGSSVPVAAGPCAGFSVLSAELQFYDTAAPGTILASYALSPSVIVTGVDIAGGALAGVDTGFFQYVVPTLGIAGNGAYGFSLLLYDQYAQLAYTNPSATSPGCVFLPIPGASCGLSANPAVGTFTAVAAPIPEPETYALMLAGLAGLGAVARRRRARATA